MADLLSALTPEKGPHRLVTRQGPSIIDAGKTFEDETYYTVRCPEHGPWGETYAPGTADYVAGWHDMVHVAEDARAIEPWPPRGVIR